MNRKNLASVLFSISSVLLGLALSRLLSFWGKVIVISILTILVGTACWMIYLNHKKENKK